MTLEGKLSEHPGTFGHPWSPATCFILVHAKLNLYVSNSKRAGSCSCRIALAPNLRDSIQCWEYVACFQKVGFEKMMPLNPLVTHDAPKVSIWGIPPCLFGEKPSQELKVNLEKPVWDPVQLPLLARNDSWMSRSGRLYIMERAWHHRHRQWGGSNIRDTLNHWFHLLK